MFRQIINIITILVAGTMVLNAADPVFLEVNGLVVVEIESAPLASGWVKETAIAGFTGSCYYTWNKGTPNTTLSPGQGVLTYRIKINTPGNYYFRWHNYHNYPADQTLENDSWLKVDNGNWVKCYQNSGNAGYWNFICKLEPSHGVFKDPIYNLTAGYHTIQISGRSYRHSIDRFHLCKDRLNLDKKLPESPREGGPIDTTNITRILSPASSTTLSEGQTYQLTGKGQNLSWSYDANSDGLGEIAIGTGETVDFKVPTGITGPREITIMLKGDGGTEQIIYNIGTTGINNIPALTDHGMEVVAYQNGSIHFTWDRAGKLALSVVSLNGRETTRLLQGDVAAGTYAFSPDLPTGRYCLVIHNGKEINIIHKLTIIK